MDPPIRRESAAPQVQPQSQGTSRELPVWDSCCFALQSPRPGGRRKRNGFPLQTNPWTPEERRPQWVWHLAFLGWMLDVSVSGDREKWQ